MRFSYPVSQLTPIFAVILLANSCHAGLLLNGADLLVDPGTTLSGAAGFTASGSSLRYNGSSNGRIRGIVADSNSGVAAAGDSYSVSVNVTQQTSDTDFGWAVTDGVNVWGMLTFESGILRILGPFNGLDGGTNTPFLTNTGAPPGVGNSGTITLDFDFDASSTTVSISGDYYGSVATNSYTVNTPFTFGNQLSFLLVSGGIGERYQLNSINSSGSNTGVVPEPTSFIILGALFAPVGLIRRRKA